MEPTDRTARFDRLVREHGDAVYRYLRRRDRGGVSSDSEALVSDVMSVAWRQVDVIPPGAELPWLLGVARRRRLSAGAAHRASASISRCTGAPEAAVRDVPSRGALEAALDELSEPEREVLTLMAWEGLSLDELAIALGVSSNTATARFRKAKARLEARLEARNVETLRPATTRTSV